LVKAREKVAIGARILASRLSGRPRPFFVQYSLLNGCNARCAYCNSPNREDRPLALDDHLSILGEFARLGAARIKFLGGEPLLVPDLDRLADEVLRLGMRAAIVTNGFLVRARLDLVRRLSEVVISIDGDEDAHDRQRGAGSWKKVMDAVELCARERLDFFLSAVVTRRSAGQVPWLLETASRLGVMVNFQIPQFNPEMYGAAARSWMPDPEEIRRIVAEIVAAKERGAPVLFSARSYRTTLAWPDFSLERVERPGEPSPCSAGRYFLQMEPNGDVYPCVLHVGTFAPKNAVRDGVEAAWRHAGEHSCFSCYNTWLNENRAIFDLHPSVLGNFWKNYLTGRPRI
ncbi:MAG TPA: radical SAM protein, partial [Thermoanaerobaculia bacterium]|nr:radical SAM protein [Thermoanaerobaculia bacterium]